MEKDYSYKYVFFELLNFIEKIEIVYQHEALATTYEDGETLDGGSQWCLSVVSIGRVSKLSELREGLQKLINQKIEYIKENRLDLYGFYGYFLECLEKNKSRIEELQSGKLKMKGLIEEGLIQPIYTGYLPLKDHYHLYQLGIKDSPKEAEHNKDSFDELHRISRYYLGIIGQELTRLILFLKHEVNLSLNYEQQLKNQKGKDEYLNLIKEGKIEQLFKELDSTKEYRYDEEIMQLSARYHTLENDKNKDVINRDEYNIQSAKLISSLIKAILKN